ncbi:MAG TPA: hypothetical protein VNN73_20755 [Blastocatellia bacterium]|jgi:hypothetical protein|nr:hypothetical protein [Blastocatellia bacterium]
MKSAHEKFIADPVGVVGLAALEDCLALYPTAQPVPMPFTGMQQDTRNGP